MSRSVASRAPDYLCFSVVTKNRTLDLQAIDVRERELWVRAIESGVDDAKAGIINFITGTFLLSCCQKRFTQSVACSVLSFFQAIRSPE